MLGRWLVCTGLLLALVLNGAAQVTSAEPTVADAASNSTSDKNAAIGFGAVTASVFLWGSNFVPLKRFESGDGLFFQWVLCSFIFMTGIVVNLIQGSPEFHPFAMIGGLLWTTGNITVVPIVQLLGLAQGMLLWSSSNLLMGYFSGRYGWFGVTPAPPNDAALSSAGVALCCISLVFYLFVRPTLDNAKSQNSAGYLPDYLVEIKDNLYTVQPDASKPTTSSQSPSPSMASSRHNINSDEETLLIKTEMVDDDEPATGVLKVRRAFSSKQHRSLSGATGSWVDKLAPAQRTWVGRSLALFAGCCYGLNFTPVAYVQDNYEGASQSGLDYVFAHFTGIYATSTCYFVLYCIAKKNQPMIYPKLVLPSMISGIMWAISQSMWFVANQNLSQTISFPIISTGPGVVSSVIGIVIFHEISGKRNFIFLAFAFAFAFGGVIMTALSN
ncbi:transmembrane protein [Capsaspora owczarzaki ATCC 30864]|uniref:transmembrane protein n=1 Tax=Capsaspora owczarzaki (strain ATCC 30864) TaxID=595528 RepID=UPI0003525EBC|nr:transmembrane protein [Capsaspora owczarzaki ATCC 30864]|eukprot:XP_004364618.2 transmembrane protein [Capsaspora owczarzaki ATCC 30864]